MWGMAYGLQPEVHPQLRVDLCHQVVGHESQAFDQAAGVRGARRLDLRLAVVVQPRALVGQHDIRDVHPLGVAGQRDSLNQDGIRVVGVGADDYAGVCLRGLALAAIGAVVDQPDVTAPDEFQGVSSPSRLSAGYVSCPACCASPSSA